MLTQLLVQHVRLSLSVTCWHRYAPVTQQACVLNHPWPRVCVCELFYNLVWKKSQKCGCGDPLLPVTRTNVCAHGMDRHQGRHRIQPSFLFFSFFFFKKALTWDVYKNKHIHHTQSYIKTQLRVSWKWSRQHTLFIKRTPPDHARRQLRHETSGWTPEDVARASLQLAFRACSSVLGLSRGASTDLFFSTIICMGGIEHTHDFFTLVRLWLKVNVSSYRPCGFANTETEYLPLIFKMFQILLPALNHCPVDGFLFQVFAQHLDFCRKKKSAFRNFNQMFIYLALSGSWVLYSKEVQDTLETRKPCWVLRDQFSVRELVG